MGIRKTSWFRIGIYGLFSLILSWNLIISPYRKWNNTDGLITYADEDAMLASLFISFLILLFLIFVWIYNITIKRFRDIFLIVLTVITLSLIALELVLIN
jgi:hypothetical protein